MSGVLELGLPSFRSRTLGFKGSWEAQSRFKALGLFWSRIWGLDGCRV